jgi:hypothetical protein
MLVWMKVDSKVACLAEHWVVKMVVKKVAQMVVKKAEQLVETMAAVKAGYLVVPMAAKKAAQMAELLVLNLAVKRVAS